MRPIKDTIPLDEAREIIDTAMPRIDARRTRRAPRRQRACARARCHVRPRRAAVFSRRDGRLRCRRREHLRRQPVRSEDVARHREGLHRTDAGKAVNAGESVEIATGAPMPDGADAVVMVEETERGTSGDVHILDTGVSATERRQAGCRHREWPDRAPRRRRPQPEPHRRAGRAWHRRRRGLRQTPSARFSRPATRSPNPAGHYSPDRFTTSIGSRLSTIIAEHGGVPDHTSHGGGHARRSAARD